jgi:Domain of unknown function (DUF5753)/Helix-turn-helix domain
VARRLLGWSLHDLRQQAGLKVKAAAAALEWSEPKLWRIETGQTTVRGLDVEAMCAVYGAPPGLAQALSGLAKPARTDGWWHSHGEAVPGAFDVYARLEEQACLIQGYEPSQIPALLRTGPYARTLIISSHPDASTQEIEELVHECTARQMLVTRASTPLAVTLILGEAVLHCPTGGAQVMAGQLRHLATPAVLPTVHLQVVPFTAGMHPGLRAGPFTLLRFPSRGGAEPDEATVYVPGLTGELYLDTPHEIQYYEAAYATISRCALAEPRTRDLLLTAARELEQ